MRRTLQHYLNDAHVYCYLRRLGVSTVRAKSICAWWRQVSFFVLYVHSIGMHDSN